LTAVGTSTRAHRSVAFEVTWSCPQRCAYCYHDARRRDGVDGSAAEGGADPARLLAALLAGHRFARVDLTGGEPLVSPRLFDIIDRVHALGAVPTLVTDGALVGPEEARDLARHRIALVQTTVLSTDRTLHARLKGNDTLDATVRAIALLGREGVPVSLSFICTRLNHGELEDVVRLGRAMGVRSVALSRLCTVGEALASGPELWPEPWMLARCLERLQELGATHHVEVSSVVAVPHCVFEAGGRCAVAAGAPNYTVDPFGRVRPCSVSSTVLGALPEDPWERIEARSSRLRAAVVAAVPERCRACERLAACQGGCRESGLAAGSGGQDPLTSPAPARSVPAEAPRRRSWV